MNHVLAQADKASFEAPSYALLLSSTVCWSCNQQTPTAALWVPSFRETEEEYDDEEGLDGQGDGAAALRYIEGLDEATRDHLQVVAPFMRSASTSTSGLRYLAHHCTSCDAVQGDHFVHGVDGPYWPDDDAAIAALQVIRGVGPLRAIAGHGLSGWMDQVAVLHPELGT